MFKLKKCITRRQGWSNVKPGQKLQPIVKGMGLKKGEKVEKIGSLIEVISIICTAKPIKLPQTNTATESNTGIYE